MRRQIVTPAIATLLLATAGTAVADHNSKNGEGWANMPNDIHNTRVETKEADDNEAFRDFVKYGEGSKTENRFDTDAGAPGQSNNGQQDKSKAQERKRVETNTGTESKAQERKRVETNTGTESKAQERKRVETSTGTKTKSRTEIRARERRDSASMTRGSRSSSASRGTRSKGSRGGGRKK